MSAHVNTVNAPEQRGEANVSDGTPKAGLAGILRQVCDAVLSAGDAAGLAQGLCASIESAIPDCAFRIAFSEAGDEGIWGSPVVSDSGWYSRDEVQNLGLQAGVDPLLVCLDSQEAAQVADVLAQADSTTHAARALLARWRAFSVAPFSTSGVRGAIAIYRRVADVDFTADAGLLDALAPVVGLAFSKARPVVRQNMDEALNKLSKAMPGVVYQRCVYPDGDVRYTYISESAREFFGVEPEKILKDPQALFQHYDPQYRDSFREKLLEASRTLSIWDVEAAIRLPDGRTRNTHAMARPERREDGSVLWTGVILDASRIKEAERAAAESEARTRSTIVESLSQGFLLFDASDRLVTANSHFYELYPEQVGKVEPGCSFEEFARREYDLLNASVSETNMLPLQPEHRMRMRHFGRSITERRLGEDRWLMVSDHCTPDNSTVVLFTDVSELKQRERRINHLAYHDSLTGLPNRSAFRQKLDETIKRCARLGRQIGVMCLDLDRFKFVNDTLGHPAGDELLIQLASRLRSVIRNSDTAARLGGDEFAIILEITSPNYAADLAWRLLDTIGKPFDLGDNTIATSTSIGIAVVDCTNITSGENIIRRADLALYRAKSDGRDRFRFFEEEMDDVVKERRLLEIDLRLAVQRDQLVIHYQPLVETASEEIIGMEALVRWQHPTRGLISPLDFIMIAEETGLISKIGEWVLRRACTDAMEWPGDIRVAVNLSPAQFRDVHFYDTVKQILFETGLPPARLELEVTESLLLRDTAENLNILNSIRRLGVRIAMDDFGTGYSSLATLRSFPFDKIKIDRAFVQDIDREEGSCAIVRAVLGLARGLGMATTAEGVETTGQFDYLRAEGCAEVQGFFFSRPFPGPEVAPFLAQNGSKLRELARLAAISEADADSARRRDELRASEL